MVSGCRWIHRSRSYTRMLAAMILVLTAKMSAGAEMSVLELKEHLQWSFRHELISTTVIPGDIARTVVRDETGHAVPCQVNCPILDRTFELRRDWPAWLHQHANKQAAPTETGPPCVRFFADLHAGEKRRFTCMAEPTAPIAAPGINFTRQQDDWIIDAGPVAVRLEPGLLRGQADGLMRRLIFRSDTIPWQRAKLALDGKPAQLVELYRGPYGLDLTPGPHTFEIRW